MRSKLKNGEMRYKADPLRFLRGNPSGGRFRCGRFKILCLGRIRSVDKKTGQKRCDIKNRSLSWKPA